MNEASLLPVGLVAPCEGTRHDRNQSNIQQQNSWSTPLPRSLIIGRPRKGECEDTEQALHDSGRQISGDKQVGCLAVDKGKGEMMIPLSPDNKIRSQEEQVQAMTYPLQEVCTDSYAGEFVVSTSLPNVMMRGLQHPNNEAAPSTECEIPRCICPHESAGEHSRMPNQRLQVDDTSREEQDRRCMSSIRDHVPDQGQEQPIIASPGSFLDDEIQVAHVGKVTDIEFGVDSVHPLNQAGASNSPGISDLRRQAPLDTGTVDEDTILALPPHFITPECYDWLLEYKRHDNLPDIKHMRRKPTEAILRALHDRRTGLDDDWVGRSSLSLDINEFHIFDHPCILDEPLEDLEERYFEVSKSPGQLSIKHGSPSLKIGTITTKEKGTRLQKGLATSEIKYHRRKISSYATYESYRAVMREFVLGPNEDGLHLKIPEWSMDFHSQEDATSCVLFHRAFCATLESMMKFNPWLEIKEYHPASLRDAGCTDSEMAQYESFVADIDMDLTALNQLYDHMRTKGTCESTIPYDLRANYLGKVQRGMKYSRFHNDGAWQLHTDLTSYRPQRAICNFGIRDLLRSWCEGSGDSTYTLTRCIKSSGGEVSGTKNVKFSGPDLVRVNYLCGFT